MARNNIQDLVNGRVDENVSEVSSAVRYDRIQIRSDEEKALARANAGAIGAAELAETKADLETQIENISGISDPEAVSQMVEDVAKHETDISDLKSSLNITTLTTETRTDLYVDDTGKIGSRTSSQIALIDLTQITGTPTIEATITGTQNRCRLLLMTANIADVVSGTTGTYIDKGNTTTAFSLDHSVYGQYNTLAICTNFQLTPYATVKVISNAFAGLALDVSDIENDLEKVVGYIVPELRNGSLSNTGNANAIATTYRLPTNKATHIKVTCTVPFAEEGGSRRFVVAYFKNAEGTSSSATDRVATFDTFCATNKDYVLIPTRDYRDTDADTYTIRAISLAMFEYAADGSAVQRRIANTGKCLIVEYLYDENELVPEIVNGSLGDPNNTYAVRNAYSIVKPNNTGMIRVRINNSTGESDLSWYYGLWVYNSRYALSTQSAVRVYKEEDVPITGTEFFIDSTQWPANGVSYAFTISAKQNGDNYTLRDNVNAFQLLTIEYFPNIFKGTMSDTSVELLNSRHATNPLTILHFSDIHADSNALQRIMRGYDDFNGHIDGAICTGDMVGNTNGVINSWWDKRVMTCIGNHDSASYDASTGYNWTALSMANRDAYYIAPFESNWGITHTSGTSYYYKDYADSKVRLIVMDGMLYTNAGDEATAQTTWLEGLLASAITNNLHVLIAIHSPHGGAISKACSFSKYGRGTSPMPTYTDCNTPQTVIDTVATKITAGLKFIGYLCGHTHQDDIWDAEGDGKQLMYTITCAAVANEAQWKNSDQYRSDTLDAYNLVTIDTTNTLVKIVRGGGADIDDHMRTRKAICFNYSTGTIVGEVL